MPLMDPSTEAGLFTPPVLTVLVLVMGWKIEKTSSGRVSPARAKALTILCLALLLLCYVIVWWREITTAWLANPFLTSFFGLGIAAAATFLIVGLARRSDEEDADGDNAPEAQASRSVPASVPRRVFSWIVIIWGIAGLLGGIMAIVRNALSH
jgi:hypothetical protein